MRAPDHWTCPVCDNHAHAEDSVCLKCKTPRGSKATPRKPIVPDAYSGTISVTADTDIP